MLKRLPRKLRVITGKDIMDFHGLETDEGRKQKME